MAQLQNNVKINIEIPNTFIHWTHINKINATEDFFRTSFNAVLELNPEQLSRNQKLLSSQNVSVLASCSSFPEVLGKDYKYRTLLYIKEFNNNSTDGNITIVTQMSYDKFPVFKMICRRWKGPISVAIYTDDKEKNKILKEIDKSKTLSKRQNIAYHLVFRNSQFQPVNTLRNVALRCVETEYVFLIDVDFVPGIDVYSNILKHIRSMKSMRKKALVVPAFEASQKVKEIPMNVSKWHQMWDKTLINQFQVSSYSEGHAPTNYTKLRTAKNSYTIKYQPKYEPYVVVEKNVPEYDERFFGYIWNKVQHILELASDGYEFIVLPNTFLVHKYHKLSKDYNTFKSSGLYYNCMENLKQKYLKEINTKYNCNHIYSHFVHH